VAGAGRRKQVALTSVSVHPHPVDLEPSLVAARTYASRRRRLRIDVGWVLGVMIVLLYLMPAKLIVPNLTYAGRPGLLLALLLWCWWLVARLNPRLVMVGPQPLRWAVLAYLMAAMLSYLAGLMRGLPTLEANAQDFAMLSLFEFLGIVLVAADGIPNWQRLYNVLRVLVYCAGVMALIGLSQSILKIDVTTHFTHIPGLQLKGDLAGFEARGAGGNVRVGSTTMHFIEFSAVMAMTAPFAIHMARFAQQRRDRVLSGICALLIVAAVPISISRTGVVAFAAAVLIMIPVWGWRARYNMLILGGGLIGALMVTRPGLLGTLRYMFSAGEADPSIQGRTDDYSYVAHWFAQRPWLGRGPRTLVPELYQGRVLDNEWLYTLVTGGIIGIAVLVLLHVTCMALAGIAWRRSEREEDRHLCAALIAAQVISLLVAATFDSLAYTTLTSTLALTMGFCGTVWRFTHPARTIRTLTVRRFVD
jgi:O-antigen ligase